MTIESPAPRVRQATSPEEMRLGRAASELEAVFVHERFEAMRETVQEGGVIDGGAGEDVFSGLMDQHLSSQALSGSERGIGAAIYRQLRDRLPAGAPVESLPTSVGEGASQ
jgi:peptidoglycan hydrolase FlgJ